MKITPAIKSPRRPDVPYLAQHINGFKYIVITGSAINADVGSNGNVVTFDSDFREEDMVPYLVPQIVENTFFGN